MPLDQLNIRTEEIDEILGKTPNKIIRWGVTVIFLIVIMFLVGSWFFKYPDFISSTIEITTLNPPADIVAKASGKIDSIYVMNNEPIKQEQILVIIENPTDYADFQYLVNYLDSVNSFLINPELLKISSIFPQKDMDLGELQSGFSIFVSAYANINNYLKIGYFEKKINAVERQIKDYRLYYNYTYDQKKTMMADLHLAEKDYQRYQVLFKSQTIPEAELEKSHSRYLNKKYSFESMRTSLANINIQISQLENSILDLQLQQTQQKEKLLISLIGAYDNLDAKLNIWEQKYVLKTPVSGICIFTKYWSKNQNVTLGEKIMTIIPSKAENIIGKLLLPIVGSGKVKTGQTVNIRLHNYPYMEFGMLEGIIQSISSIPNEDFYYVEVVFPKGMKTSYGIDITFSQKMKGSAEIVTEDIRVIYRILQPIKSVLTNRL